MTRITGQIRIARPAAEVFDFIADPRNEPGYSPAMRDVELLTGEPIGPGTRFRALMGRGMPLLVALTDFEPPHRLGSHTTSRIVGHPRRPQVHPRTGQPGTWSAPKPPRSGLGHRATDQQRQCHSERRWHLGETGTAGT